MNNENIIDDFNDVPVVSHPKDLKKTLYRHQLTSIYYMEKLEQEKSVTIDRNNFKETCIGILADTSGYGKTLSIIGLIVRNRMEWNMDTPYVNENIITYSNCKIKKHVISRYDKLKTTLILVPVSIIHQWFEEFKSTSLKVFCVKKKKDVNINPIEYDVILVIPTLYNILVSNNSTFAWKRFIFDEPSTTRVTNMRNINAGFYWLVTATPSIIVERHWNCKGFMKDLLTNLNCPYIFDVIYKDFMIKNDIKYIQKSYNMPVTNHIYYECFQSIYNVVNGFVPDNIATMISAGNIEGAILALGGNKTGNIIELLKNKKLEELEEIESKIRIYTIRNDEARIEEWSNKKKNVLSQLEEIQQRFERMLHDNCSICYNQIESHVLEPKCQNFFCGECLLTWLKSKKTCPLCRNEVDCKRLIYVDVNNKIDDIKSTPKVLTKQETILSIINKNKHGKFLVFSEYDDTFQSIYNLFTENNIVFEQIKGRINRKEKIVEEYKTKDLQIIFLNSTSDCAGLNLQETTDIIIYHEMDVNIINQIIGRANRIGRTCSLNVHYLTISNNV